MAGELDTWRTRPIVPPCTGYCRGERAASDGPTIDTGKRTEDERPIPGCRCCGNTLTMQSRWVDDTAAGVPQNRLADVRLLDIIRWQCLPCGYDSVSAKSVAPK